MREVLPVHNKLISIGVYSHPGHLTNNSSHEHIVTFLQLKGVSPASMCRISRRAGLPTDVVHRTQ